MSQYEDKMNFRFLMESKIKEFADKNGIKIEHFSFNRSCHSVEEAAATVNADKTDFVKNICLISDDKLIVCIVKGEDRLDIKKVESIIKLKLRMSTPEEILEKTGYPCGGTPSFGYDALFLIDERVIEKEFVYSGGGSETSLIKINTKDLMKANSGEIVNIRK